jgi:hypothetical protein
MVRSPLVTSMLALALVLTPKLALADDKADCFDAAEKAQRLKNEKKITSARPVLLICSRDICPQQVRVDCVKWLGEVDNSTSTVVVRARDADGHDLIDVRVLVDGVLLLPKLQGTSVAVDPGQHKFRYELPSGKVVEEDVLIAEGEKDRVIRIDLKDAGVGAVTPPGGGGGGGSVVEEKPKGGGPGAVPWVIGGVGLASLIGFAIVEIPIQSQFSDLQNGCGKTGTCTQAQKDSLTSLYAPAAILLGVGIVGVAVSATWLIVSAVTGHPKSTTGSSFGVTPVVGGAFASFSRSF